MLVRALARRLLDLGLLLLGSAVGTLGRLLRLGIAADRGGASGSSAIASLDLLTVSSALGGAARAAPLSEARLRRRRRRGGFGGFRGYGRRVLRTVLRGEVAAFGHHGGQRVHDGDEAQGGVVGDRGVLEPRGAGAGGDVVDDGLLAGA
ncbi:hypothetical protein GXW82_23355 [Streptacidiphilus sp. 4-A2]|nr:hypothetical protein [Streptacidiphilus sp. 4-A2]